MKTKAYHSFYRGEPRVKEVQLAHNLYQRVLTLAAKWAEFDPFNMACFDLYSAISVAYQMMVSNKITSYELAEIKPPKVKHITDCKNQYATFRKHVSGIEAVARRLRKYNPHGVERFEYVMSNLKEELA